MEQLKREQATEIVELVYKEIRRAEMLYPVWPKDIIHAAAILGREAGEVLHAATEHVFRGRPLEDVRTETIQTAAMAIRLLMHLPLVFKHCPHCGKDYQGLECECQSRY